MLVKKVCQDCNSENIEADAWAEWDVHLQQWKLLTVLSYVHCKDCASPTQIINTPLFIEHPSLEKLS